MLLGIRSEKLNQAIHILGAIGQSFQHQILDHHRLIDECATRLKRTTDVLKRMLPGKWDQVFANRLIGTVEA